MNKININQCVSNITTHLRLLIESGITGKSGSKQYEKM